MISFVEEKRETERISRESNIWKTKEASRQMTVYAEA